MIRPTYNRDGCKNYSFAAFRKLHENIEYFLYLSDDEWKVEYEMATGKKIKDETKKEGA